MTAMMVSLVLAFTLLWLPFFSASLYLEFMGGPHTAGGARGDFRAVRDFLQLVGYSTCVVNPVIYTFFNRHFQDRLCALCCRPAAQRVRVTPVKPQVPAPDSRTVAAAGAGAGVGDGDGDGGGGGDGDGGGDGGNADGSGDGGDGDRGYD